MKNFGYEMIRRAQCEELERLDIKYPGYMDALMKMVIQSFNPVPKIVAQKFIERHEYYRKHAGKFRLNFFGSNETAILEISPDSAKLLGWNNDNPCVSTSIILEAIRDLGFTPLYGLQELEVFDEHFLIHYEHGHPLCTFRKDQEGVHFLFNPGGMKKFDVREGSDVLYYFEFLIGLK